MSAAHGFELPTIDLLMQHYARYLGAAPGGVNLLEAAGRLPWERMETCLMLLCRCRAGRGRVFIIGNGGSYDDARLLIQLFSEQGVAARAPGFPEDYLRAADTAAYGGIFVRALQGDRLSAEDLVIGLSGSGNSPNMVEGLQYARGVGAEVFAFGGRDGGAMGRLCGEERSLIARIDNMEAIEDLHCVAGMIIARSLASGTPCEKLLAQWRSDFQAWLTGSNLQRLAQLGRELLRTVRDESFVFVLGTGIGANHFRADAQRGFTNAIPLRGLAAPELFTVNSGMATLNDDGPAFLLADGLAKYNPGKRDFALLFRLPGSEAVLAPACELLDAGGTPRIEAGAAEGGIDCSVLMREWEAEFVPVLLAHASGAALREVLSAVFCVRLLPGVQAPCDGQRKPRLARTLELEAELRLQGVLGEDEVLTFQYGQAFAAADPALFGMRRVHY